MKKEVDDSMKVREFVKFYRLELILIVISFVIALLIPVWNVLYRAGSTLVIFIFLLVAVSIFEKKIKKK